MSETLAFGSREHWIVTLAGYMGLKAGTADYEAEIAKLGHQYDDAAANDDADDMTDTGTLRGQKRTVDEDEAAEMADAKKEEAKENKEEAEAKAGDKTGKEEDLVVTSSEPEPSAPKAKRARRPEGYYATLAGTEGLVATPAHIILEPLREQLSTSLKGLHIPMEKDPKTKKMGKARVKTLFTVLNEKSAAIAPATRLTDLLRNHAEADEDFADMVDDGDMDTTNFGQPETYREATVSSDPQGPHVAANAALEGGVEAFKPSATKAGDKERSELYSGLQQLFSEQVEMPTDVAQILIDEEPGTFGEGASPNDLATMEKADGDRLNRLLGYMRLYQETYNMIAAFLEAEASAPFVANEMKPGDGPEGLGDSLRADYKNAFDGVTRLLNLHPYATYAWREQDSGVTKGEIAGKGEGTHIANMVNDKLDTDKRMTSAAETIDGIYWQRGFNNPQAFKTFLQKRMVLMLRGKSEIGEHELDDVLDAIMDIKGMRTDEDLVADTAHLAGKGEDVDACAEQLGAAEEVAKTAKGDAVKEQAADFAVMTARLELTRAKAVALRADLVRAKTVADAVTAAAGVYERWRAAEDTVKNAGPGTPKWMEANNLIEGLRSEWADLESMPNLPADFANRIRNAAPKGMKAKGGVGWVVDEAKVSYLETLGGLREVEAAEQLIDAKLSGA